MQVTAMMMWVRRALLVALIGATPMVQAAADAVLLVPGISTELFGDGDNWGVGRIDSGNTGAASPMVVALREAGYRFGGVIGADGLPAARPNGEQANLFALRFSAAAINDGLGLKGLELAAAIALVRQRSGAARVSLVAYSAGGLVARAYLQGALPGLAYRGDVDRLITISTPHMGAELAAGLGDLFGTRVHSLRPDAPLIEALNDKLALPEEVVYASLIVRGMGADQRGGAGFYARYFDRDELGALPTALRTGGDQVVHVASQNLSLTRAAHRYEQASGRPVLYPLITVQDPSPADASPFEKKVHEVAPVAPAVVAQVRALLVSEQAWRPLPVAQRLQHYRSSAQRYAGDVIEQVTLRQHPLSQVLRVSVDEIAEQGGYDTVLRYHFKGRAYSRGMILGLMRHETRVEGEVECRFDRFGRVRAVRSVTGPV